ncbi:MAG: hypothetical protein M1839_006666 [Geoglossum umbratile]|nr:MAG: hypothetical protein M1839_006666 [Geoglossum umbratile]
MPVYSAINPEPSNGGSHAASASPSARGRRRRRIRSRKDVGITGQASWTSSVVNLVNTIIGAGVLAMPSVLSHMGIVPGVFIIIWAGLTSGFGLYLQTRAAVIFDAAIAIKCFGVSVSYLIIIGDLMPGVVRGLSESAGQLEFLVDRHFWVTAFMLVVIPLSFLRRLDSLKYTSVVALISIGYLVVLVVAHFCKGDTMADRGDIRVIRWGGAISALSSFPVVVFAYTCHQNMFSVLNEISNNSHSRTTGVIFASIGSACAVYILVAITGYLSFGNSVSGNIIGMYIPSIASTIGKAAIVVLVMFSYPLQVHPCRASVDAVLKWRPLKRNPITRSPNGSPSRAMPLLNPGKHQGHGRDDFMGETRFAAITTTIIVSSYLVAMTVTSLERALAYVGSTGSTSISFILPGLFYYKISAPDSPLNLLTKEDDDETSESENEYDESLLGGGGMRSSRWKKDLLRTLSLALAIYGFVVMVVCFITNTFFIVAH